VVGALYDKSLFTPKKTPQLPFKTDKDYVWECTGYGLTAGYKLSHSDVSCEGYDYPDDPYILKGSCGVFFGVNKDLSYKAPTTTTTTTTTFENQYTAHDSYIAGGSTTSAGGST